MITLRQHRASKWESQFLREHRQCLCNPPSLASLREKHKLPQLFSINQRQLIGTACCRTMIA
eukprot:3918121-Amphidinium_carterae.1